jgi:hypothetical protein
MHRELHVMMLLVSVLAGMLICWIFTAVDLIM